MTLKQLLKQDKLFIFEEHELIVFIISFILADIIIRNYYKDLVLDEEGRFDQNLHLGYIILIASSCAILVSLIEVS